MYISFLSAMVCLVGGYRDALRFKAVSVYILPVSHGVSCGRIPGCSQVQGCKCISFLSAMVCLVGGYRDALRFKAVSVYILPVSHGVSCGRIPGCSQVQGCKCIYPSCQPCCVLWEDTWMLSGSRL